MNLIEHECLELHEFIKIAGNYWSSLGWIFRGQSRDANEWPLLPKAGRPEYFSAANDYWRERGQVSNDLGDFRQWREAAIAFTDNLPTNDFECLAYAQHYGLATRLLDWTTNPLVALFFSVESDIEKDGLVFCHRPDLYVEREKMDINQNTHVACFIPRPFDRRIASQSGVFTLHPKPNKPLLAKATPLEDKPAVPDGMDLVSIRVPADMKKYLQRQLGTIGVSRKTLFPDLEGLSSFINWNRRSNVAFKKEK